MFRLTMALKGYREAGSLNDQINLFGFVDDHTFLTKTGDVGVVLAVKGPDSPYSRYAGKHPSPRSRRPPLQMEAGGAVRIPLR